MTTERSDGDRLLALPFKLLKVLHFAAIGDGGIPVAILFEVGRQSDIPRMVRVGILVIVSHARVDIPIGLQGQGCRDRPFIGLKPTGQIARFLIERAPHFTIDVPNDIGNRQSRLWSERRKPCASIERK